MKDTTYSMAFTTGALYYQESMMLAELYREKKEWKAVRAVVMEQNLLQARTMSTAKKVYNEIVSRLKLLTDEEMRLLCKGSRQEQLLLLWLAVCKRYLFIREFAVEVLREKFLRMNYQIDRSDYNSFFDGKALLHEELDKLSPVSLQKIRMVIFKMMREAELISRDNIIQSAFMSPELVGTINQSSRQLLDIFPVLEGNIKEWLT